MEGKLEGETKQIIHIIYFLSHGGRVEQPHLFLVHHNVSCGVCLRDMKSWLEDLRGKDMPGTFAWSYKRRYKNGHIWQDLVDDEDLIVPISDGEYILQGSAKAVPIPNGADSCSTDHLKRTSMAKQHHPYTSSRRRELKSLLKTTTGSFESETPTMRTEKNLTSSFSVKVSNIKRIRKKNKKKSDRDRDRDRAHDRDHDHTASSSSTKSMFTTAGKASHMFRNFIRCRAIETKDAALMTFNRAKQPPAKSFSRSKHCMSNVVGLDLDESDAGAPSASSWIQQQLSRRQIDSRKSFDDIKNRTNGRNKQRQTSSQKVVSAAYMPVSKPKCSQCGKSFRPEKLHKHMKSCRGLKAAKREDANTLVDEERSSDLHDDGMPQSPDFNRQNVRYVSCEK